MIDFVRTTTLIKKELEVRTKSINIMKIIKEVRGLKCSNYDYVRDNYHFLYEEAYPGARPLSSTRCIRCGYTMSLHKPQK